MTKMTEVEGLLKMADIISVDDDVVISSYTEDGVTTFFDINDQPLAQLPGDEERIIINMSIQGENTGVYYSYDLNSKFIGVSLFVPMDDDDEQE